MDVTVILPILLYLIVFIVIVLVVFIIILLRASSTPSTEQSDTEEAKIHADTIIHRAMRQANKILVSAELRGIRSVSESKIQGKVLTDRYEAHLAAVEETMRKEFEANAKETEASYRAFIETLTASMNESLQKNQSVLESKSSIMVAQSQELINRFVEEVQGKVRSQVDAEMAAAKVEIAMYTERRKRILNEKILDIVSDVVRLVVGKTLTKEEHAAMIFKALTEAKKNAGV
jgi:CheY-specific phosphatase CheX